MLIFSAEAQGILLALGMVRHTSRGNLLFLFDSLGCKAFKRMIYLIAEVLCCVDGLLLFGIEVVFIWVPSHVGLAGNSVTNIATKAALLPMSNLTVTHSDYNSSYVFTH